MIDRIRMMQALHQCRKGLLPGSVCSYLEKIAEPLPNRTDVSQVRFVTFDTETTGFDIAKDRIISIGAVGLHGHRIMIADSFEVLIRQEAIGDRDAVSVHGLLRRDIDQGLDEREAVCRFLEYLGNGVIIAHHADYDIAMINRLLGRHYGLRLFNEAIDTASFAKRLEKGPYYNLAHKGGEYRLDNLCERYGMRLYDRHTSAGDAYLTAQLFQRLMVVGKERGINTLGKLLLK